MTGRPLLEVVARAICRASGVDPDQPVYRDGNPESGVLYFKWKVYRGEAKAAIDQANGTTLLDVKARKALYEGAKATGLTRTTLHATTAGAPVYERVGYRKVAAMGFYGLRP